MEYKKNKLGKGYDNHLYKVDNPINKISTADRNNYKNSPSKNHSIKIAFFIKKLLMVISKENYTNKHSKKPCHKIKKTNNIKNKTQNSKNDKYGNAFIIGLIKLAFFIILDPYPHNTNEAKRQQNIIYNWHKNRILPVATLKNKKWFWFINFILFLPLILLVFDTNSPITDRVFMSLCSSIVLFTLWYVPYLYYCYYIKKSNNKTIKKIMIVAKKRITEF